VLGGRFVAGLSGEQFAHPHALDALGRASDGASVTLAACDPLNLTGGIMAADRVPARVSRSLTLVNGDVVDVSSGGRRVESAELLAELFDAAVKVGHRPFEDGEAIVQRRGRLGHLLLDSGRHFVAHSGVETVEDGLGELLQQVL
jgi:hypothetical protein